MTRSLKLTVSYDGGAYVGWQMQTNGPSVQSAIEAALHAVTGESIRAVASGRTDSGVHALGQVVSVETDSRLPCNRLLQALNARLPNDVVVRNVEDAPDGFHAINDSVGKRYRYVLHDGRLRDPFLERYAWHVRRPLDASAMHAAAQRLIGKHDFASFESAGSPRVSTVRTITDLFVRREPFPNTFFAEAMPELDEPLHDTGTDADTVSTPRSRETSAGPLRSQTRVIVEVAADGFLYNMVRNIVGTLVLVGRGRHPAEWIDEVLAARDRTVAGPTAPPHGLFLVRVDFGPTVE